jgi:hypothetical protein
LATSEEGLSSMSERVSESMGFVTFSVWRCERIKQSENMERYRERKKEGRKESNK